MAEQETIWELVFPPEESESLENDIDAWDAPWKKTRENEADWESLLVTMENIEHENEPEEGREGKLTTISFEKVVIVVLSTGRDTTAVEPELPKTEMEIEPSIWVQ